MESKSLEELENLTLKNLRTPLVKLPLEMFDKIIENLDLASFLRLKETCKAVQSKCQAVTRGPFLEVDDVHYKDGRIMFITVKKPNENGEYNTGARSGDWFKNDVFQLRCETLQCHMQGDIFRHDEGPRKFKDEDITRALNYLNRWNLKAKRLSLSNLACSPEMFSKLVKKLQISEIECYEVADELINNFIWMKMTVIITQSVFPDDSLLQGNFKELRIRIKDLNFKTIEKILQELRAGSRSIEEWHLLDVPGSLEQFQDMSDSLKDKNGQSLLEKIAGNAYKMHNENQDFKITFTEAKTLLIVRDE